MGRYEQVIGENDYNHMSIFVFVTLFNVLSRFVGDKKLTGKQVTPGGTCNRQKEMGNK